MAVPPATTAAAAIAGAGVTPPPSDVSARLDPRTAAGVDLAKWTLWIIGGTIALLVILLLVGEIRQSKFAAATNEQQLALVSARSQAGDPRLTTVVAMLRRAAIDPVWKPPAPDVADAQRAVLEKTCMPLPLATVVDRPAILERCALTLETLLSPDASLSVRIGFVEAMQRSLAEERAAQRAFWLQVAQLVLVNLLLPILTGLLGYIFGTRSA
jgi:hypothetical protein